MVKAAINVWRVGKFKERKFWLGNNDERRKAEDVKGNIKVFAIFLIVFWVRGEEMKDDDISFVLVYKVYNLPR